MEVESFGVAMYSLYQKISLFWGLIKSIFN
jgi:hypothetical protein